jgi:glycosyltransferase involved in cell wall biosynthesis
LTKIGETEKNTLGVTFVIPMKNAEHTIEKCLRSIVDQAEHQDYDIRIIVVDDASEDSSVERITKFKAEKNIVDVKIIRNKFTKGRAATRNIGLCQVQTPYVAFVDSDVQLPYSWLETCIKQLQKEDTTVCVSARVQPDGYLSHFAGFFGLSVVPKPPTNNVHGSNMLCNSEVIRELRGFDARMPDGEDTDLGYRLLRKGFKIYFVDDLICRHYVQPSIKSLMRRSFSHGLAGTLLFMKYRKLKVQDLAFLALLALLLIGVLFWGFLGSEWLIWLSVPGFLLLLVGGTLFSMSNFNLTRKKHILPLLAIISSMFIVVYLLGRLIGTISAISKLKYMTKPSGNVHKENT